MDQKSSDTKLREELDQKFEKSIQTIEEEEARAQQEWQKKLENFRDAIVNNIWDEIRATYVSEKLDSEDRIVLILKRKKHSNYIIVWRKSDAEPIYPVFTIHDNSDPDGIFDIVFKDVMKQLKSRAFDDGIRFKRKFSLISDKYSFIYVYDDSPLRSGFLRRIK